MAKPDETVADGDLPGMVGDPHVVLPSGYRYGVTRYADLILENAFPEKFRDLTDNLEDFYIDYAEDIVTGGGSRARHTKRHDDGLTARGWHKHNVTIEKRVDGEPIFEVRNHEIDVFTMGDDVVTPASLTRWNGTTRTRSSIATSTTSRPSTARVSLR